MFDDYEKVVWERIKHHRFMLMDALTRADDGLTEDRFDIDQWGYAYVQLNRAMNELQWLLDKLMTMRTRRMRLGSTGDNPELPNGR